MSAYKSSILNLLNNRDLSVPVYQRPYKWTDRNVQELLTDISHAIDEWKKYPDDYKYRIGTILLHDDKEASKKYIVDGQQRLITAGLICLALERDLNGGIFACQFTNPITLKNIHRNYEFITQWFSLKTFEEKTMFSNAFENIIEVVVIEVGNNAEAFQLFDSQNSRGKPLDPHALLKAYHLREMASNVYEMEHAVKVWEDTDPKEIKELFEKYLFPICKWTQNKDSFKFNDKSIDQFKGTDIGQAYSYAMRAFKASPHFQINEPFIAGNDFFLYVSHYLQLKSDIRREIEDNHKEVWVILHNERWSESTGFKYAVELFYVALLCYYDKFHVFDKMAIYRLVTWALMIRVDMSHLGKDTINKYALGTNNNSYTNHIPMFSTIVNARRHTDISNLTIKYSVKHEWITLADKLKELNKV